MIDIDMWTEDKIAGRPLWHARDQTDYTINATADTQDQTKAYIVEAWNRENEDTRTLDDFAFTVVDEPPADWP